MVPLGPCFVSGHKQHGRELKFGANLNRFEDIGVDLNSGVSSWCRTLHLYLVMRCISVGRMKLIGACGGRDILWQIIAPQGAEMTGCSINTELYGNMQEISVKLDVQTTGRGGTLSQLPCSISHCKHN